MKPNILILRAPGTNCDRETAFAFEKAGGTCRNLHINRVLENPGRLDEFQILCIPGGFSYGDDVAAGRILASRFRNHLLDALRTFRDSGKLILGICNGFQVLIKSGLLFADDALENDTDPRAPATLTWNDTGLYMDRWVDLRVEPDSPCVFLRDVERLSLPIAHAEGRFVGRDEATLDALQARGQLVLRYEPQAPNGACRDVAGACDPTGHVFGLMPHPERFIDLTQHPRWTRNFAPGTLPESPGDGFAVFRNAVAYFA